MVKIAKAKAGRTRTSMLKYALEYADLGYYVVPLHSITAGHCTCPKKVSCPSAGKHPLTSNGVHDATRNRKRIKKWFSKYPHANIGIATGLGKGLLVLDVDKKNKGYKTLSRLKTELGNLPITIVSNTGGGGRHYLLKHPKWVIKKDNRGKLFGEGIDVLTDGCFFAAPPSLHISGQKYSWAEGKGPIELGPKALPRSWLKKISAGIVALPTLPLTKLTESKILIREGQRNSFLTTIAGGLNRPGIAGGRFV